MAAITLPKTTSRVSQHTSRKVNERILQETQKNVERFCGSDRETLARRLDELDREWDIERAIQTGAAGQILLGLALGSSVDRRWYSWSGLVAGFLLLQALHGWAPPVPILRRLGFRTQAEIEEERDALRLLRGDFTPTANARAALAQARLSSGPGVTGPILAIQSSGCTSSQRTAPARGRIPVALFGGCRCAFSGNDYCIERIYLKLVDFSLPNFLHLGPMASTQLS